MFCSLSFGPLSGFRIFNETIFNFFDKLSANVLMTAGALLTVLSVGWKMKRSAGDFGDIRLQSSVKI